MSSLRVRRVALADVRRGRFHAHPGLAPALSDRPCSRLLLPALASSRQVLGHVLHKLGHLGDVAHRPAIPSLRSAPRRSVTSSEGPQAHWDAGKWRAQALAKRALRFGGWLFDFNGRSSPPQGTATKGKRAGLIARPLAVI